MRPLPATFDHGAWRTVSTVPTRLLRDGDTLDLGGRTLQVLHTPGHTPDCICLLDDEDRILFTGDTIDTGPIYAQFEESSLDSFAASTKKLLAYADRVDVLFSAHGARYQSYPELIPGWRTHLPWCRPATSSCSTPRTASAPPRRRPGSTTSRSW